MTSEQILVIIAAAAPSLVTFISSLILTIINKITSKSVKVDIKGLRDEIKQSQELSELKLQFKVVQQENIQLKSKLNALLTKIDKVVYKDEDDKENETM